MRPVFGFLAILVFVRGIGCGSSKSDSSSQHQEASAAATPGVTHTALPEAAAVNSPAVREGAVEPEKAELANTTPPPPSVPEARQMQPAPSSAPESKPAEPVTAPAPPPPPRVPADGAQVFNKEKVTYTNPQGLMLAGIIYKPDGAGPFPAIVWNHGSERDPESGSQFDTIARQFVPAGYVVMAPEREGHSSSQGNYIVTSSTGSGSTTASWRPTS